MNEPRKKSAGDTRKFTTSVFDLAYGTEAEMEAMSASEIRAELKEAAVDVDASWSKTSKMIEAIGAKLKMADAHKLRTASVKRVIPSAVATETRESLLKQIEQLFSLGGTSIQAMYACNWEHTTPEDLTILRDQIKKTIERESSKPNGGR